MKRTRWDVLRPMSAVSEGSSGADDAIVSNHEYLQHEVQVESTQYNTTQQVLNGVETCCSAGKAADTEGKISRWLEGTGGQAPNGIEAEKRPTNLPKTPTSTAEQPASSRLLHSFASNSIGREHPLLHTKKVYHTHAPSCTVGGAQPTH